MQRQFIQKMLLPLHNLPNSIKATSALAIPHLNAEMEVVVISYKNLRM
jgi:hypothetical protein